LIHELQAHQIELEIQNEELRKAQLELEEARNKYFDQYDLAPVGYFTLDKNGLIVEGNLTAVNLLGVQRRFFTSKRFSFFIVPECKDVFYSHFKAVSATHTKQTCELKLQKQDGTVFYVQMESTAFVHGEDDSFLVRSAITNITKRKQAEQALSAEKERLHVTLCSIGDGVITMDQKGNVLLVNKAAEDMIGLTQEEAKGKPFAEVFYVENKKTHERLVDSVKKVLESGQITHLPSETILIANDGAERIIADSAAPIYDHDGSKIGVVLVFRDITKQRRMEEELYKIQKLESLGTLAGGIAHDFNNILTGIMGNIALAKLYAQPEWKGRNNLNAAEEACFRAQSLTDQLLTFSGGGAPLRKSIAIKKLLRDSINLSFGGSNVRCEFSIPKDLWHVEADSGQIAQAVYNVLINAKQAMPNGGVVHVRTENIIIGADQVLPLIPGRYVKISVEDHGVGISHECLLKIFDPFFTTKQKASGMGLTVAHSIIKKHHGHIAVESEPGVATTFNIYLPAMEVKNKPKTNGDDATSPTDQGKVLFMDDEEIIRDTMGQMLALEGYDVEMACDGAEVIRKYQEARKVGEPFDVVIMDLTVPGGMGGKEAIKKLLEIDPQVKALITSGYSNDAVISQYKQYGFCDVVTKPYNKQKLNQALSKAIAAKRVVVDLGNATSITTSQAAAH